MWFTETAWPPMLLAGVAGCVLLGLWLTSRRKALLVGGLAAFAACVAIYLVEQAIVTDAERVEANVYRLTESFQKKDEAAVLALISAGAKDIRKLASQAIKDVDVGPDLDVKDVRVEVFNDGSQASSTFRANGTFTYMQMTGYHPSRWDLRWQLEGGEWKIVEAHRLSVLKDKRIGTFDSQE